MLPRVTRQADKVAAGLVDGVPVDLRALKVETGEVAQHLGGLVGLALERAEHGAFFIGSAEAVGDGAL